MGTTNTLDLNNRVSRLEKSGGGGGDTSALVNKTDIAPEFSDATNYYKGDLVYYNGVLYEFQLDHTAGAWDQSEVQNKDLSDILNNIPAERITYDNTDSGLSATDVQGAVDELNSSKMNYNAPRFTDVMSSDTFNTASTDEYAKQVLNVGEDNKLYIGNRISCEDIVLQTDGGSVPISGIVKILYDSVDSISVITGGATTYNFYSRANSMTPQGMKLIAGIYAGAFPKQSWNAHCALVQTKNDIANSKIEVSLTSVGQAQDYSVGMHYIYIPA